MFDKLSQWLQRPKRTSPTDAEADEIARELNAPLMAPIENPPPGFESKHRFVSSDILRRLSEVDWFCGCGSPPHLDLTMDVRTVDSWHAALESASTVGWENVELAAQNQLTMWLHIHDYGNYQQWNAIVQSHKATVLSPLIEEKIRPFLVEHALGEVLIAAVQWDILGALMENSYLTSGHSVFFFLELLQVYEAGHFPCGWIGDWPRGELVIY